MEFSRLPNGVLTNDATEYSNAWEALTVECQRMFPEARVHVYPQTQSFGVAKFKVDGTHDWGFNLPLAALQEWLKSNPNPDLEMRVRLTAEQAFGCIATYLYESGQASLIQHVKLQEQGNLHWSWKTNETDSSSTVDPEGGILACTNTSPEKPQPDVMTLLRKSKVQILDEGQLKLNVDCGTGKLKIGASVLFEGGVYFIREVTKVKLGVSRLTLRRVGLTEVKTPIRTMIMSS